LITFLLALLWLTPGHAEVIYPESDESWLTLKHSFLHSLTISSETTLLGGIPPLVIAGLNLLNFASNLLLITTSMKQINA